MKKEYEEKIDQLNGSLYVLRMAHNSLETRLKSNDLRRESADKEAGAHRKEVVSQFFFCFILSRIFGLNLCFI